MSNGSSDIPGLQARRSAIIAELAAMSATAAGGIPTYSADGVNVDHVGYKKGLYDELNSINALLIALRNEENGPFEISSIGM